MNLLLLSINVGAVPDFLNQCVGALTRPLRLGYVPDAAEGMPFAEVERASVEALGYEVVDVRARASVRKFDDVLSSLDAIYVAGGQTFVLLEALRSSGTDKVLAQRVRAGLPYIGCSAGSIIVGPSVAPVELMDDRGAAPGLDSDAGLHLIDQVIIPHADGQLPPYPVELIERIVSLYGGTYPLLTLRDDQALRVMNGKSEVITYS